MNNSWGEFIVKLPETLELVGNWKVGVDEIAFPIDIDVIVEVRHAVKPNYHEIEKHIHNIEHHYNLMKSHTLHNYLHHKTKFFNEIETVLVAIPKFSYNKEMQNMIAYIQKTLTNLQVDTQSLNKSNTQYTIGNLLSRINTLNREYLPKTVKITDRHSQIDDNTFFNNIKCKNNIVIKSVSVHTDIVDVPPNNKIKTCQIKGLYKDEYTETWPTTQYFKVNKSQIEYIKISLKDSQNNIILLNSGPVCITLHLKK
jgi:hypothetical protein